MVFLENIDSHIEFDLISSRVMPLYEEYRKSGVNPRYTGHVALERMRDAYERSCLSILPIMKVRDESLMDCYDIGAIIFTVTRDIVYDDQLYIRILSFHITHDREDYSHCDFLAALRLFKKTMREVFGKDVKFLMSFQANTRRIGKLCDYVCEV